MKIGILGTINNPMLGLIVKSLSREFEINCIILDAKDWTDKDKLIWKERTNGKIKEISPYSINESICYFLVDSHNSSKTEKLIIKRDIDLLINSGTPRILESNILNSSRIGVLNCHPGLLPNYRGCTCVEWALFNNDPVGNTAHLMTEKIDEGPILIKKVLNISKFKTYEDIRVANYLDSISLISDAVKLLNSSEVDYQDYPKGGKYYSPIDKKRMGKILKKFV